MFVFYYWILEIEHIDKKKFYEKVLNKLPHPPSFQTKDPKNKFLHFSYSYIFLFYSFCDSPFFLIVSLGTGLPLFSLATYFDF